MRKCILLILVLGLSLLMISCASNEPAYMHPYGEGVDPDTVTTIPFQTRTTSQKTINPDTTTTKPTLTTVPNGVMEVDVPEGHILCPLCQGVLVVCEKCFGTTQIKAEILDADSGIYVRKYVDCTDCAEDPGYSMCELCQNQLYIEE